jgi:hypothetical protein
VGADEVAAREAIDRFVQDPPAKLRWHSIHGAPSELEGPLSSSGSQQADERKRKRKLHIKPLHLRSGPRSRYIPI